MSDDSTRRIQQGEIVKCDECKRARPIEMPPVEMFGSVVGYGPGGSNDLFIERGGTVKCRYCTEEEVYE